MTTKENPMPITKSTPEIRFSRRAGGSWIVSQKVTTQLGTIEEVTLSTTLPPGVSRRP